MSLMGVDIGTTGVKAVVFSTSGEVLSSAYREYDLLFPFTGASELDSRQVLDASFNVITQAAGRVHDTDPVEAIGIASQGEAFIPVTAGGEMLANIMTSSDSRAGHLIDGWLSSFGREKLYGITGHTPSPMYSLFKLLWIKQNQPEVWERAWKFLFCQDLLAYALTGETATDYTMAARSLLFDVEAKKWSAQICDGLELDRNRLPAAVPSGTVIGTVKPDVAEDLALTSSVKVAVCGHDQPVSALGAGAAKAAHSSYSIGTVECICPATDRFILADKLMDANLVTYPHVLPGLYTTVAFNITGGSVLKWVRDNLATEEASSARSAGDDPYNRIIAAASDKPSDLVLLGQFGPTGTPYFDADGTGVLFGLSLSSSRSQVLRAFLEGITYEMKLNLSILEDSGFKLSEMRAVGGGARSDKWMQIKADILGVPLTSMQVSEATCMGAAMLAGGGTEAIDPAAAQSEWAVPIKTFEPHKQNTALYEDRFALYKELYNSLGRARKMLASIKGGHYDEQ